MARAADIIFVSVNVVDRSCHHIYSHCSYATSLANTTKLLQTRINNIRLLYLEIAKGKGTRQKDALMDQSAQKAAFSPQIPSSHSSIAPSQKVPTKEVTEMRPDLAASHSKTSSPVEPFPELDLEVGAEPNPDPTFPHEADISLASAALALPGPAIQMVRDLETGPVITARVAWTEEQEGEEEHGDMREATARALKWAKKMFGRDAERRVEGGEELKHDDAEDESL